ncbi:MAG: DUF2330 domain-containing protein, partial [Myxococcales bacterium]|nr:DUF2330 domain-containing protein [Myxococcales bacterium]
MARKSPFALCFGALLAAGPAFGLGTFIGPDGSTVPIDQARTLFVRGPDSVRIVTQVHYQGTPGKLLWILAIPNFNNPADDGVVVETLAQAALDELDGLTYPRLEGACDGAANGQSSDAFQRDAWGPAPNMALPARSFPVPEIEMGRLATYAGDIGVTIDEPAQAVIDAMVDQNFMLVTLRIDTTELGVNRVDPIVSIRYPLEAGDALRVALFPSNTAVAGDNSDFVWWTLGNQRMRSNLTTNELDFETVHFVTNAETNYVEALDQAVAARQTQMFITEYAQGIDGNFTEASLEGVRQGASFLTRMRARLGGPALRANAIVSLRDDGQAAYENTHQVQGFMCGGNMPDPDMGVAQPDMGGPAADMGGEVTPDMTVITRVSVVAVSLKKKKKKNTEKKEKKQK